MKNFNSELFPIRFDYKTILDSMEFAKKENHNREIVLLFDNYVFKTISDKLSDFSGIDIINCSKQPPAIIESYDMTKTIFVYACDNDDIGLPFVRKIVDLGGKFCPISAGKPASYVSNANSTAREVLEEEFIAQEQEGFAKFYTGVYDFVNIIQAIDLTRRLNGDFIEIGCFRGSSGRVAVHYMNKIKLSRKCYFLDVFEGFTYEAANQSSDTFWRNTHKTEGIEVVSSRLKKYELPEIGLRVNVIKSNIIDDQLPSEIKNIAVANIDVDLYEAVKAGLCKVAPKIIPGGIMIAEDPGHTPRLIGARLALEEFLNSEISKSFTPLYMESGQWLFIKK
jgi:hypothetical protein